MARGPGRIAGAANCNGIEPSEALANAAKFAVPHPPTRFQQENQILYRNHLISMYYFPVDDFRCRLLQTSPSES
jgi:hypothetical protein